ncbi:MAG: hypothetical protein AAF310_02005 [Myxococcota bacterium]
MRHTLHTYTVRAPAPFVLMFITCFACWMCGCASRTQVVQPIRTPKVVRRAQAANISLKNRANRLLQEAQIRFAAQDYAAVTNMLYPLLDKPNLPAPQKQRATLFVAETAWRQRQLLLAWLAYESLAQHSRSTTRQIARARLMQIANALGQWQQLSSFYKAYAAEVGSVPLSLRYLQGKALFYLGKNSEALQHLTAVTQTSIYFYRAKYLMGTVYVRLKNWPAAARQFEHIVQQQHLGIDRVIYQKALLAIARLYDRQQNWQQALAFYQRVDKDSEQYVWALYEQALLRYKMGDAALANNHKQPARKHYTTAADFLHKLQYHAADKYRHPKVQILLADIARKQGMRTRAQAIYTAVLNRYQPIYDDLAKTDKQAMAVQQLYDTHLFVPPAQIAGQYATLQQLQASLKPQSAQQQPWPQAQLYRMRVQAMQLGVNTAWAPMLRNNLSQLLRWARAGMVQLKIANRERWLQKMNAVQQQRDEALQRGNRLSDEV